jgi:apolipoprotein N-acyltransferase
LIAKRIKGISGTGALFVLSAALLTFMEVPWGFGGLAWFCLVPFILACKPEVNLWRLIWVSYVVSSAYWLINLHWIGYVTVPGYVLFCLYLGLYWPILAVLVRHFRSRWKWLSLCVVVPFLFLGAESWQGILITGFSWRLLGHSQYENLRLIQIADILGAAGVSLLVAMVNGLLAELIIEFRKGKGLKAVNFAKTLVVATILLLAVIYGQYRLKQGSEFIENGPVLGSVQPNIPSNIKELADEGEPILNWLLGPSNACFEAGAKLVCWPETMVLTTLNQSFLNLCKEDSDPKKFHKIICEHSKKNNGYLIVGAHSTELEMKDQEWQIKNRSNSAFLYRPDGIQDEKIYNKIHLVPFGEYIPGKETFIYKMFKLLSPYDYDYHLIRGEEYTVFAMETDGRKYHYGAMICYEDTDAKIIRKMVVDENSVKKIDWLINISNDGWYVDYKDGKVIPSGELSQRTAITVFRAVENRISIIRSVNTGISCLIDSTGKIRDGFLKGNLPLKAMDREGVEGWFVDRVSIDKRVTFFSKHGKVLDFCCAIGFCLVIMAVLIDRIVNVRHGGKNR